jgi:hypothetical protein
MMITTSKRFLSLLIVLSLTTPISAEVVLDGTLSAGSLQGPNFAIEARMGQQRDNNLFHSFETFNINLNESVTFMAQLISKTSSVALPADRLLISMESLPPKFLPICTFSIQPALCLENMRV